MKWWQNIILKLLYFTPIGYILSYLFLIRGNKTPGISVILDSHSPIKATIKTNPSFNERFNWFVNGLILSAQAIIITRETASNIGGNNVSGSYAFAAFIFGLVSFISAIFPNINWNKHIF